MLLKSQSGYGARAVLGGTYFATHRIPYNDGDNGFELITRGLFGGKGAGFIPVVRI